MNPARTDGVATYDPRVPEHVRDVVLDFNGAARDHALHPSSYAAGQAAQASYRRLEETLAANLVTCDAWGRERIEELSREVGGLKELVLQLRTQYRAEHARSVTLERKLAQLQGAA